MFVLEDCMAWLANRSSKVFSSVLDSHFAALEVTRVQWMALYYMNRNPEQKQTELAERLNCKSAALARLLDRMEKDGMLTRSVNAENRRSNRIELTEKGRRLCAEGTAIAERFMDDVIFGISEQKLELFKAVLRQMVGNAEKLQK
ncbi:MarR family transcriptional regulator [Oribacterium sp. oral taxon 102]|uniref:MarR family winged helix-turn-helix transcriptional regulator n=1 Tax=Oribacterium sp. oral taxon 102 TaxID=671214 RepID=UPI0015C13A2B|nr:MarR family transcriptional regulator [Oribacterium sp. oral taxon 102]NWO20478.1 MarR family transcriptional regulator [Oribacterium sp. oral taxon 102]